MFKLIYLKEVKSENSLEGLMLKLKLQYFGHLMWRTDSLEKTLMLGKTEDRRRRGWQRTRWLGGITDSVNMDLSQLWEMVKDREAKCQIPYVIAYTWRRERLPTPVFWPREFYGLYSPWGLFYMESKIWYKLYKWTYLWSRIMDTENRLAVDSKGRRVKEGRIRSLELADASGYIHTHTHTHTHTHI